MNAAAFDAFMNSAQICVCAKCIGVDEKIADAFIDRLVTKAAAGATHQTP